MNLSVSALFQGEVLTLFSFWENAGSASVRQLILLQMLVYSTTAVLGLGESNLYPFVALKTQTGVIMVFSS